MRSRSRLILRIHFAEPAHTSHGSLALLKGREAAIQATHAAVLRTTDNFGLRRALQSRRCPRKLPIRTVRASSPTPCIGGPQLRMAKSEFLFHVQAPGVL